MKKMLLAGILGGVVAFIWSAISHMLLPIGSMGISVLPNEDVVLAAMKSNIQQPGFYMFPGMDMTRTPTEAENQAHSAKVQAGPSGVLVYHPQNGPQMSPKMLLSELLTNILCGLIAAIALSMAVGAFGIRALLVGLMGLFAWLAISASHWIWYGYPTAFIVAEGLDQVIGWLLAGFLMARMVQPAQPAKVL